MLLLEIFDTPYSLVTDTPTTNAIKNNIRTNIGNYPLIVYEAKEDSSQIFLLMRPVDGWEVHHILVTSNGEMTSGNITNSGNGLKFISTALSLYKERLSKGHSIRIVADPNSEMWQTYEKVIRRIVSSGEYVAGEVDHNYRNYDGHTMISQVIKNRGKFTEMLNKLNKSKVY